MEQEFTANEFAEMVEHAAVRVRVVGKASGQRTMSLFELKALFYKELAAEVARRATEVEKDRAAREVPRSVSGLAGPARDPRRR